MLKYLLVFIACYCAEAQIRQLPTDFRPADHPRLLLPKGEERSIQNAIATDPIWRKMHNTIIKECDIIINQAPVERVVIGRRLLDVSREALRRIYYLSYAYRVTQEQKYSDRIKKEVLAVCEFSDWNPTHFLDVAEMTLAVSIAYDWIYYNLTMDDKKIIREAIVKKGIEPSFDKQYNWFLEANQNWNQVCNAGMTYGALSVWEDYPGLSKEVIERALNTIHLPMEQYKPDGGYPEGYGYWNYGTSFNVMFLSAIERSFGNDFGLSALPGFMKTAAFMENMTGNTGLCFNWADCLLSGSLKPTMFWFAQRNNDPSLLWEERRYLESNDYSTFTRERLLPNVMIWGKDISISKVAKPRSNMWVGQGASPVAAMRSSWDNDGIYTALKAGTPSSGHGHMDVGSFIMESNGVRWASDLGMQDYESLESRGMEIFGKTQDAVRWKIYRMNSYSHNILVVDSMQQLVNGYAVIDKFSDNAAFSFATSDLTSVYRDQLTSAKRGVAIVDKKYVIVRDEITAPSKQVSVRWAMLTSADVKITGSNTAELMKNGKKLLMKVNSTEDIKLRTWSTAPTNDYDAPNEGTAIIGFETEIQANEKIAHTVFLIPEGATKSVKEQVKGLDSWGTEK